MTYQARVYIDGKMQAPPQPKVKKEPKYAPKKEAKPVLKAGSKRLLKRGYPLFDYLIEQGICTSDADIARLLDSTPNYVCRLRNGHELFGPKMILMMYDKTDMSIEEIRSFLKDE